MNTAERQIEDLARTVACPVCGAPPGRRCRYPGSPFSHSHTGRLKKARGEGEYECMLIGCEFVGTKPECLVHQTHNPGHDDFWSVPSWAELAGETP